ncbi:MAG: hypothetical protein LBS75_02760 [Synergistaceae bacterium]|nr:hypothetical protein [Synergistaceae bacterium]
MSENVVISADFPVTVDAEGAITGTLTVRDGATLILDDGDDLAVTGNI